MSTADWIRFAVGVAVVVGLVLGLDRWAGVGLRWLPLRAIVRAMVQLSIVALLLHGVLNAPATVIAFVALMLTTASVTAAGRLAAQPHGRMIAVIAVLAGAVISLTVVFATGLLDLQARYVIATGGIVIGNAMSASTLAGRNYLRTANARLGEIEGWLALGATPAQATLPIGQEAARESLLPTMDQTRSTGLVTLPGAFVGALFGGASPVDAARFQIVVLASVALAMLITAVVVTRGLGRSRVLPVERLG